MTTVFIVWGALILAVVGCAILNPRPTRATEDADDQAEDETVALPIVWLPFP
jgi:hypothetical protein